ncbi:MAG: hypothetical protein ACOC2T_00585 [Planctomycetota bacterium]
MKQIKERSTFCFLISLLDRCYRNQGWADMLKASLSRNQRVLLNRLVRGEPADNIDVAREKLRKDLAEQLNESVVSKAVISVLLRRRLRANPGAFPKEVTLALLEEPEWRPHVLRWLVLSGEDVPAEVVTRIAAIASDQQLGYEIRSGAIRAYAACRSDGKLFKTLANQLRKNPSVRGDSLKEYYYKTVALSKLLYDLRSMPDSRRADFLVRKELDDLGIWRTGYFSDVAEMFYPLETFQNLLGRLEEYEGDLQPGKYQSVMRRTAKEVAIRGMLSEELADRLKEDLLTLPRRKLRPIIDGIGGTGDWEQFGLTMIQCYRKYDESKGYNTVRGGIAAYFMKMDVGEKNMMEVLRNCKKKEPYQQYADTIDDIIGRMKRIRKRLGWPQE